MTSQTNEFYNRLGVKRIINAASWITVYGGSIMPTAVVESMNEASRWFIDLHELNQKAGEVIARLTGAEAGLVTAGSAAGMVLESAACIAGTDPARIWQLPDTTGMKDEIVIHRAHRVNYDHSFRVTGAKLVEIGNTGHDPRVGAGVRNQREHRCCRLRVRPQTRRRPCPYPR